MDDSKLLESTVLKGSVLNECYFSDGYFDGQMESGIFRSGKLGENAYFSDLVKMMNSDINFFNLKTTSLDGNDKNIFHKKIDKK